MNMSMKRIQAIFMKDYKEFSRNYAVSAMVFMPIFLAFFFNKMGVETIQDYLIPINTTLAMVTAFVQCCLMAEEKENNTLRSLTMSPASIADILVGKSSLVFSIINFFSWLRAGQYYRSYVSLSYIHCVLHCAWDNLRLIYKNSYGSDHYSNACSNCILSRFIIT